MAISNRKLVTLFVSLLLVFAVALSACSKSNNGSEASSSPSDSPKQESTSPSPSAEQHEPVTLTMSWWGEDARHSALSEAVKLFEQKYDWITVKATPSGWDGYNDKLTVQLSTKQAPDVFMYTTNNLALYAKQDTLLNYLDHSDVFPYASEIAKSIPTIVTGGKLLGIPSGITIPVIMYNKKVFDDANVAYPTDSESWVSFYDKVQQIHKANPKIYVPDGLFDADTLGRMIVQLGGTSFLNGDVSPATVDLQPELAKKALGLLEQLWATGTAPRATDEQIGFDAGNMAASITPASTYPSNVTKTQDPLGMAIAPMTFDGNGSKVGPSGGAAGMWGIPSSSSHQEEAMLLVDFLTTDHDALKAINMQTGVPPVQASVEFVSKEVVEAGSPQQQMLDIMVKAMSSADSYYGAPMVVGKSGAIAAYNDAMEKYYFKQSDMDQFIEEAQKTMNSALADADKQ